MRGYDEACVEVEAPQASTKKKRKKRAVTHKKVATQATGIAPNAIQ